MESEHFLSEDDFENMKEKLTRPWLQRLYGAEGDLSESLGTGTTGCDTT